MNGFETARSSAAVSARRTRRSSSSRRSPTRCTRRRATPAAPWTTSPRRSCRKSCAPRCACSSNCSACGSRSARQARGAGQAGRGRGVGAAVGVPRRGQSVAGQLARLRGHPARPARLAVPDLADLSLVTLADDGQARPDRLAWVDPDRTRCGLASDERTAAVQSWLATRSTASGLRRPRHVVRLVTRRRWRPRAGRRDGGPAGLPGRLGGRPAAGRARQDARGSYPGQASAGGASKPDDVPWPSSVAAGRGVALDNALLVRDIQENDLRKNEFLAMLSHELRNPLAPMQNAVSDSRPCGHRTPEVRLGARGDRPAVATWCAWSMTCWTCRASPAARSASGGAGRRRGGRGRRRRDEPPAHRRARPRADRLAAGRPGARAADPARLAQVLATCSTTPPSTPPTAAGSRSVWKRAGTRWSSACRDTGGGIAPEMLS